MLSACAAQTATQPENPQVAAWKKRAEGVTIVRDDWGVAAHLRQDRRRRRVRADVCAGRGRLQPRRDQLHQFARPARRGRGREGNLARPADEALHRSRRHEGQVQREPGLAEGADGRLGRRPQFLSRHASQREAARDHQVRAVDGAVVQRGQHWRRHRKGEPYATGSVLRIGRAGHEDGSAR